MLDGGRWTVGRPAFDIVGVQRTLADEALSQVERQLSSGPRLDCEDFPLGRDAGVGRRCPGVVPRGLKRGLSRDTRGGAEADDVGGERAEDEGAGDTEAL